MLYLLSGIPPLKKQIYPGKVFSITLLDDTETAHDNDHRILTTGPNGEMVCTFIIFYSREQWTYGPTQMPSLSYLHTL